MAKKHFTKKFHQFLRRCPLTVLLLVSWLGLTVYALVAAVMGIYQFHVTMKHPARSSVLLKEYSVDSKWAKKQQTEPAGGSGNVVSADASGEAETVEDASGNGTTNENPFAERTPIPTQYEETKKKKENSPYYDDPGRIALTTDYPYITVDSSYYDDAVFIGDSRIEGLHDYSGLDNATFYYKEGLTVYDMMSAKIAKVNGKKVNIKKALAQQQFNKVYIMIGINELGYRTTPEYAQQYQKNLEEIRQLQPNAVIFIMGVMHVTTEYSNSSEVFNNVNINDKNVAAAGLANGVDIFYLDVNPVLADKKGGVKKKYTWDGIHLKAEYYNLWVDFLNVHGLEQDCFPAYKEAGQNL